MSNQQTLRNVTNQMFRVVEIITLHVKMGYSRLRVNLGAVHNLAVPVLLGTSYIDKFEKDTFSPECKLNSYNSKLVSILAVKYIPE